MAHTPQNPTTTTGAQLAIRSNTTTIVTVDLITPFEGAVRRNYAHAQAFGSTEAVRTGDGRFIIDERQVTVLVTGSSAADLARNIYLLEQALQSSNNFLFDGVTVEFVGSPGITGVQYAGATTAQVTIAYAPRFGLGTAAAGSVIGPL